MVPVEKNTINLLKALIESHIVQTPFRTGVAKLNEISKFLGESLQTKDDPKEGTIILTIMTQACYEEMQASSKADTEGWLQQCMKCRHRFITADRQGSCAKCGHGYEILSNREEL